MRIRFDLRVLRAGLFMRPRWRILWPLRSGSDDERQAAGDDRQLSATTGSSARTNGTWPWRAAGLAAVILFAICTVNALSLIDKAARAGEVYESWRAFGEEYSSWAGMLLALAVPAMACRALDQGGWPRRLAIVLGAALLFCLLHTTVMVALRMMLWPLWGERYVFHVVRELPFELRKDAVTVGMLLGVMLVDHRWPRPAPAPRPPSLPPRTVRLEDGARSVLVTLDTLCAAEAVGNYVELVRCDGSRMVLRTTLAAAGEVLRGAGFLRVHRRWLVSAERVTGFTASGNGDWRATLPGGLVVPVSRRQSAVIRYLRARVHGEAHELVEGHQP